MNQQSRDAYRQISESDTDLPEPGIALCLSGGGYRAMLFHLGTLWRLNELGFLPQLKLISSVSGGSITNGMLGYKWTRLRFDGEQNVATNFNEEVVTPLRKLASCNLDVPSFIKGIVTVGGAGAVVANYYDKWLFKGASLQALPDDTQPGVPRFVFNATSLQTASDFRFTRGYMADYKIGIIKNPTVRLADAVAASGAFPPFLSPLYLKININDYTHDANDGSNPRKELENWEKYATRVILTDGGVYDNMGLEPAYKNYSTVLVSDGGGQFKLNSQPSALLQMLRVIFLFDNAVRNRRKVELVAAYKRRKELLEYFTEDAIPYRMLTRSGAYWRMTDDLERYHMPSPLRYPVAATRKLAAVGTRLAALDEKTVKRLINFGYVSCDVHMRAFVDAQLSQPSSYPYPEEGIGEM